MEYICLLPPYPRFVGYEMRSQSKACKMNWCKPACVTEKGWRRKRKTEKGWREGQGEAVTCPQAEESGEPPST